MQLARFFLCLLALIVPATAFSGTTITFDFAQGSFGWTAGFADYPTAVDQDPEYYNYELQSDYRSRPANLGSAGSIFISGHNHSDDLFMFLKKPLDGLLPNTLYKLTFRVELASKDPTGLGGIGGSPGDSVWIKAGVSATEPDRVIYQTHYRMNIDKGNQSIGGPDALVLGTIAKPEDGTFDYALIQRDNVNNPKYAWTDASGRLWLLVGTDSGFEGPTSLYYTRITVELEDLAPAQYGWSNLDHRIRPTGANGSNLVYDEVRGELILFGGATAEGLLRTWIRRHGAWRRLEDPAQPPDRYGAAMVYDAARREVVLFGGYGENPEGGAAIALADMWIWNGATWRRVEPPASPSPRAFSAMAYDRVRARVVLFGGRGISDTGVPFSYLGDTWTWNGNNWTRESPSASPPARNSAGMVFDKVRGETVLFGGDAGGTSTSETWTWNGATWTQKFPTRAPQARTSFGMAYDSSRQRVVLFSGVDQFLFHDTWVWDGTEWTDVTPADQPEARFSPAVAFDATMDQVVLFGGHRISYQGADTWGWDGTKWSSLEIPTPLPRFGGAMAYDPVRSAPFLFGGIADPIFGDMWTYGLEWHRESLSLAPPARCYAATATDTKRNEVVLFGGLSEQFNALGDTWIWNGSSWHDATPVFPPALSPPPRQETAIAYHAVHEQIVLFGGWASDIDQLLSDTWTWDGTSWELQTVVGPAAIKDHAMAYDAARQEIVLYGGIDDLGEIRGETWTWNGGQWTMKSPPNSPPAAASPVMVYDPTVKRVLLFGGIGNPDTAVWAWDGSTWTKFDLAPAPARRSFSMMAFVPELGGSLLFGGSGSGYRDDTWLLRMPPVQVLGVVSRRTHGAAGVFDIDLPFTGAPGIECRSGGASDHHEVVVTFVAPVTFGSASVTSGTGSVAGTSVSGNQVFVNLAGVANAQTIELTLFDVSDGTNTGDVLVRMGVLLGDTNTNKVVSNTDVASVKGQVAAPISASNFRTDVNANGVISNTDVSATKAQVGTSLP